MSALIILRRKFYFFDNCKLYKITTEVWHSQLYKYSCNLLKNHGIAELRTCVKSEIYSAYINIHVLKSFIF